ncbi:hypothetical protein N9Z71_03760, partial [Akkermansiaceae bacterium]|nr:hypothetical protein [Akkermansiaceae bacterium]
ASFLETGDSKDDLQAIYVIKENGQVQAFRGYFVPGFGGAGRVGKGRLLIGLGAVRVSATIGTKLAGSLLSVANSSRPFR